MGQPEGQYLGSGANPVSDGNAGMFAVSGAQQLLSQDGRQTLHNDYDNYDNFVIIMTKHFL